MQYISTPENKKNPYLLPHSDVCTIEMIQFLNEPLLIKHDSLFGILHLIKPLKAVVSSLSDSKERNQEKCGELESTQLESHDVINKETAGVVIWQCLLLL